LKNKDFKEERMTKVELYAIGNSTTLESSKSLAGMTPHPNAAWMMQIARNVTMEAWGFLSPGQYLIHDRDGKYCPTFQQIIDAAGVTRVPLPPRSPNLNAYAERWVRSVKEECLSRFILFGEASLRYALAQYGAHFHHERNHQGKGNVLLFPTVNQDGERAGPLQCRERLGGLLKYQIPADLVVKCQAIDIIAVILSQIW
jgi:hypothetical protein